MPELDDVLVALAAHGVTLPPGRACLGYYGDTADLSRSLLSLIRSGRKRAGTGLVWLHEHENEPLPTVGDIEIVLTHDHRPSVVTRTTSVEILPYRDVSAEYAAIEGEGDGSLDYWRSAHWAFFSRVCDAIGRVPSEDMLVVCATFEVLHVLPQPRSA